MGLGDHQGCFQWGTWGLWVRQWDRAWGLQEWWGQAWGTSPSLRFGTRTAHLIMISSTDLCLADTLHILLQNNLQAVLAEDGSHKFAACNRGWEALAWAGQEWDLLATMDPLGDAKESMDPQEINFDRILSSTRPGFASSAFNLTPVSRQQPILHVSSSKALLQGIL